MTHKILFIDDEEKILLSLKRLFRNSEYEMYFISGGKEGVEFLQKNNVSVIISDMKMPEMNGVEFLEEAMKICPDAVRIILSGYSEADKIMEAINKGNIWRFIPKPWNNDEIRVTIKNAVDIYERENEKRELTRKLQLKTIELDDLNKLLEKKVEERTWHLNERTRLLNMLLEDVDPDIILKQICLSISRILDGAEVFVRSLKYDKLYSAKTTELLKLPDELVVLERRLLESGRTIANEGYLAILLKKSENYLGTLLMEKNAKINDSEIEEHVSGFSSLLDIVIFQSNLLASAPVLIQDIDKMIGSI